MGLGLEVPITTRTSGTLSVRRWLRDSGCPARVPSTCGEEGWSFTGALRPYVLRQGSVYLGFDIEAGWYRFTSDARRGHGSLIAGGRVMGGWGVGDRLSFDVGPAFRRIGRFEDDSGLAFPAVGLFTVDAGLSLSTR